MTPRALNNKIAQSVERKKNKGHGINGADLCKCNAPSLDPDRSQANRNKSDGYDKNNNVNINSHNPKQFQI